MTAVVLSSVKKDGCYQIVCLSRYCIAGECRNDGSRMEFRYGHTYGCGLLSRYSRRLPHGSLSCCLLHTTGKFKNGYHTNLSPIATRRTHLHTRGFHTVVSLHGTNSHVNGVGARTYGVTLHHFYCDILYLRTTFLQRCVLVPIEY